MNSLPFRAPWLLTIARVFALAGEPLYAVGGVVRNAVMDLPASDIDLCGPARPERITAICEGTPVRAVLRAAHFGTVELHVAQDGGRFMAEYTTFRVDSYRCGHQPVAVRFADTIAVDALRRDFSVNALYRPLQPDPDAPAPLQDPTGGLRHLAQGVLHTVTADPDQVLKDDGLRILRAARFQAELGLTPTPALLASAARYAHLLDEIARARLRDEVTKLLLSDKRYPTLKRTVPPIAAGLATLRQVGAWQRVFGALAPEESALAALACYAAPEGMPPVCGKFALLFFHETPDALAYQLRVLRYSVHETAVAATALAAMRGLATGSLSRMDAFRLGRLPLVNAACAFAALAESGIPCEAALTRAQDYSALLSNPTLPKSLRDLAIHGDDLLPLCLRLNLPRNRIGATLDALWQAVVEQGLPNEPRALLKKAQELLTSTISNP